MPPLTLRDATLDDLPALVALADEVTLYHHHAAPDTFAEPPRADADEAGRVVAARRLDDWRRRVQDADTAVLVAERDGTLIGFVDARIEKERSSNFLPGCACKVGTLGVTASARSGGVGRALMAALEDWARLRGATQVHLNVWHFNTGAARLYEELGFAAQAQFMVKRLG